MKKAAFWLVLAPFIQEISAKNNNKKSPKIWLILLGTIWRRILGTILDKKLLENAIALSALVQTLPKLFGIKL